MLSMDQASGDSRYDYCFAEFGQRLRALRKEADMDQAVVAERAGIDRGFLGGVERGERNISLMKVFALAEALDADIVELFTGLPR